MKEMGQATGSNRTMGSDRALRQGTQNGPHEHLFRLCATMTAMLLATCLLYGCKRSSPSSTTPGSNRSQAAASPRTDFEQQLDYVRTGQFNHIYVFTRKDGGAFDKEDVDYLTANSPVGEKTNMRVKTSDGRRVIIGTNFEYEQAQFDTLAKRFNIEDYTGR